MAEASIVLKAYDHISGTMKSVSTNSRALSKEFEVLERSVQQLGQRNESFNKSYAHLSAQALQAKNAMQEASRQFKKTGGAADRVSFERAKGEYKDLTDATKAYEAASKSTRKEMNAAHDQMRRMTDGVGGDGGSGGGTGGGILGALSKAGLGQLVSKSVSELANTAVGSAFGSGMGGLISSAAGGALSGAALGSMAGPLGAAVGAAVGGAAGLISGGSQMSAQKDEAFKGYVQDAYQGIQNERDAVRGSGSTIAGSREQTQIAFAQRLGSDQAAAGYLDKVKEMAKSTNYDYDAITGYSKKLLNSYGQGETLDVLQKLSDATAGLNLDNNGVEMFINGLSRMRTTGKATQEYLNYFSERGLDVYSALSDTTGANKKDISGMVTRGEISGETAAQAVLDYIDKNFGGLSEKLAGTYKAMVDNLGDAQADIDEAYGKGYNDVRKEGVQAQMDYLGGSGGGRQKEANAAMGAWEASLENAKEKAVRDAVNSAMSSNSYRQAQAAGDAVKMGELIARAKIQGQNAYNASEGAQLQLESEKSLIAAVREDAALHTDYYDAGYTLGMEFSKGRAAAMLNKNDGFSPAGSQVSSGSGLFRGLGSGETPEYRNSLLAQGGYYGASHAYGLQSVPFDGYRIRAHQGEQLLTAAEARERRQGGQRPILITGNEFHVRSNDDIDAMVERMARRVEEAELVYGG